MNGRSLLVAGLMSAVSALASPDGVNAQQQGSGSSDMASYSPSSVLANEDKLSGKTVRVEGKLENQGTNYFTDRRLVVVDSEGKDKGTLPVRAWLPSETPPAPLDAPGGPAVLSQFLGKKVVLEGTLKEGTLRGFGKVKYLDVSSARAVE